LDEHVEHLHNLLNVLYKESLYANMKKYICCMERIMFLGYVVNAKGIKCNFTFIPFFHPYLMAPTFQINFKENTLFV
jgi:hypothetical protein